MEKHVTALIIDDDRAVQRMLAEMLGSEGFAVQVEKDGSWAFKTFSKRRPDVVILDLLLPSMHGFEFARRIRMLPGGHDVPLIFISGAYKINALHSLTAVFDCNAVSCSGLNAKMDAL